MLTYAKSSGLIDGTWKITDTTLRAVMQDTDNEKNNDDKIVEALYNVDTSKKYAEKQSGMTEFGDMPILDEGEVAATDTIIEDYPNLIAHKTISLSFSCTKESEEDGDPKASVLKSKNFIRSYKRSRAEIATRALVTEGATFVYGGKTLPKTTGDGLGLFATAHKSLVAGVATQSNVFTTAFGADATSLYKLASIGKNFKNASGKVQGYDFDTIIIPSDCPAMQDLIERIINSSQIVGSAYNDVNTQMGKWKLVVDHRWATDGASNPYILMSSEANKELQASMFFDRIPLDVASDVNIHSRNLEFNGRARVGVGFFNWRHVIMGGASAGSTL